MRSQDRESQISQREGRIGDKEVSETESQNSLESSQTQNVATSSPCLGLAVVVTSRLSQLT